MDYFAGPFKLKINSKVHCKDVSGLYRLSLPESSNYIKGKFWMIDPKRFN